MCLRAALLIGLAFVAGAFGLTVEVSRREPSIPTQFTGNANSARCFRRDTSSIAQQSMSIVSQACTHGCFTIQSSVRVDTRLPGRLFVFNFSSSVFEINIRRNTDMRIHYTSSLDGNNYKHRFIYRFNLGEWYDLAVTICPSTQRILLHINCNLIYNDTFVRPVACPRVFNASPARSSVSSLLSRTSTRMCIGGDGETVGYTGFVRNVKVSTETPECCQERKQRLERTVRTCQANFNTMQNRWQACELDKKACVRRSDGRRMAHGSRWNESACTQCECFNTQTRCQAPACPFVGQCRGDNMRRTPVNVTAGQCCAKCVVEKRAVQMCSENGREYMPGMQMAGASTCRPNCFCVNGTKKCPPVTCPPQPAGCTYTPPGECCPTCRVEHPCDRAVTPCGVREYSNCLNLGRKRYYCLRPCRGGGVMREDRKCYPPTRTGRR